MVERLYDTMKQAKKREKKRRRNQLYGKSMLERAYTNMMSYQWSKLRGSTTAWWMAEPETYDNPWDAPVWRDWQGRADEFWGAYLK